MGGDDAFLLQGLEVGRVVPGKQLHVVLVRSAAGLKQIVTHQRGAIGPVAPDAGAGHRQVGGGGLGDLLQCPIQVAVGQRGAASQRQQDLVLTAQAPFAIKQRFLDAHTTPTPSWTP